MKVGDLVELSVAGQGLVYCQSLRKKKGLIVEIRSKTNVMYPIVVQWFGAGQRNHRRAQLKDISQA